MITTTMKACPVSSVRNLRLDIAAMLGTAACLVAPLAGAQESDPQEALTLLDVVVVTGTRMQKEVKDVTTSISVLDEQALAEQFSVSTDVFDALNATVPGLNVNQGIRQGCETNIRGRAASFQINGIPVNQDLRESNCNAMYQVSPFALETIEVVRGATALYGAGAPGGVVNLITRRAGSANLEVDGVVQASANPEGVSDTGEFDFYAGAGQNFESWDYYAGVAHRDVNAQRTPRDGFVPLEEYTSWSFNGAVGASIGETGRLRLTGTFYREERGREYAADGSQSPQSGKFAPVVIIENNPYKHQGHDQLYTLVASYEQSSFLGHRLAVSGYAQDQEYIQRANFWDAVFGNFFFDSDTQNERQGVRSTLARAFELGERKLELEYGIDWVRNRFYRPQVDPATDAIIGFVAPETILRTISGFAQADYVVGRLRLSGGARYERYRGEIGSEGYDPSIPDATTPGDIGKSDLWLYNIGAVYDLTARLQLYGGFSQGAELSQLARAARGLSDPGVITPEPATSNQYEIGIRGGVGPVATSVAAFYSESNKAASLQTDPSCAGQPFCPLIPLRSPQHFKGLEATADWKLNEQFTTGGIFTYQRGRQFSEDLGRFVDYSLDTVSPTRITAYVYITPVPSWRSRIQATYFDSSDYFAPYNFGPPTTVHTDSVFLMDASSSYTIGPGEITLSIANLLDEEYVNAAAQASGNFFYFMEQGRRVSLGYRMRF
jgi:iron complex outermembrane receptor protein